MFEATIRISGKINNFDGKDVLVWREKEIRKVQKNL